MSSRVPFLFIVFALIVAGCTAIYHRYTEWEVPLTPGEKVDIWQIEATVEFQAKDQAVDALLALPQDPNYELIREFTASPAYGVEIKREEQATAHWSKRQASGPQTLYYQATYKPIRELKELAAPSAEQLKQPTVVAQRHESYFEALLDSAYEKSGNDAFFVSQLLAQLNLENQHYAYLESSFSKTEIFLQIMRMAKIHAKEVKGLVLEDGRRNQKLVPLVKVYMDGDWDLIHVESKKSDDEFPIIVWQEDDPALLDLVGGSQSKVRFSIAKETQSAMVGTSMNEVTDSFAGLGLYSLPIAEQNMFKGILLLPIGALVVVFLRVLVGLKCSGTFMPILIATSFIQTELVNGLLGFLLIVSIGLLIRSYLSKLNLLLVARISTVVIVVIAIIMLSTVFAFRLGLTEALTIAFFPMIIMAWTIERMSILWEEEGGKEVLVQGSGSLIVAVLAYVLMDNDLVRHWAFNFLGIHLLIMAAILLMGQYTGYRLLELYRFKPLAED